MKRRLVSILMCVCMIFTMLPTEALASLADNTPDQNAEILEELTAFWGDEKTAQEAMELLLQYGLIDEDGNLLTDWDITLDGQAVTLAELSALLEQEDTDLTQTLTVDGVEITLADFKVMLEIEAEVRRIQETYFTEDGETELTTEQATSLMSLYEQLSENGIMLYSTRGANALEFPSGADQTQRVSVPASISMSNGGSADLTVALAHEVPEGKTVSLNWRIAAGSASGTIGGATSGTLTFAAGEQSKTLTVNSSSEERWNGSRAFVVEFSEPSGALFANEAAAASTTVKVTKSHAYPTDASVDFSQHQVYAIAPKDQGGILAAVDKSYAIPKKSGGQIDGDITTTLDGRNVQRLSMYFSGSPDIRKEAYDVYFYYPENIRQMVEDGILNEVTIRKNLTANQEAPLFYVNQCVVAATVKINQSTVLTTTSDAGDVYKTKYSYPDLTIQSAGLEVSLPYWQYTIEFNRTKLYSGSVAGCKLFMEFISYTDTKTPTVKSVTAPDGTYSYGQTIPITVEFSEPVYGSGLKLTANGTTLSAVDTGSGSFGYRQTFLYTVPVSGDTQLQVTSITGGKDLSGKTMSAYSASTLVLSQGSIEDAAFLSAVDDAPAAVVGDVTYYPAQGNQAEKTTATVNVTLDLPTDENLRNLIVPAYFDGTNYCSSSLAASIDGGDTLIPLVLDNGTSPSKLTATVEIDAATLVNQQNFVMEFYRIDVDTENANAITGGDLLFGRYAAFSVNEPVPLEAESLSIVTPTGWPTTPIYVNDPPETAKLTLTDYVSAPEGCTWTQTRWVSSDESIATIDANGTVYPLSTGTVKFYLEALNGGLEDIYGQQRSDSVTLTIQEGSAPYLRIPEESISIRSGDPVTLRWASNLVQKNAEFGGNAPTTFTIKVYEGKNTSGTPIRTAAVTYNPADTSDSNLWVNGSPNQSFTLTGLNKVSLGSNPSYTIVLSVETNGNVPSSEGEYTATAQVYVVSQPVSVKLTRPEKLFVVNDGTLAVPYTLTNFDQDNNAEFELVVTNNATGEKVTTISAPDSSTGDSFTIDLTGADIPDDFRTIYDVSLKAKNTAEKDWSRDSFTLYIYDKNCLDILVQPVGNGRVTVNGDGNRVTMSNEAWIASLSQDQILALNRDIDLQTAISINYGAHAWGEASDRIRWASQNSTVAAVNYPQGAYYENVEGLSYTSYAPAIQFLLSGKSDGTTVVEAIHDLAGSDLSSSVDITVETLKDKLYLFQFYPVGNATLTYTNGSGVTKTHSTDSQGRAAVYEASGIASDVYVEATIGEEKYLGTVYREDLVSQEKDAVSLELYPLNSLNLRKAATLPVYLKKPDGTDYNGSVTVRAGVYRNGEFCQDAKYSATGGAAVQSGFEDCPVTFTKGKATFQYDLTQFNTNNGQNPVTAADDIRFVLELRADGYYPVLFIVNGSSNADDAIRLSERIVNLEAVPAGQENQPFISRQALYFSGKESGAATDVRNKTGKVGPSADYPDVLLSTTVFWWGSENDGKERSIRYIDGVNNVLTNQKSDSTTYPFCSIPVSQCSVNLNQQQFEAIGLEKNSVRQLCVEYVDGNIITKKETMRWQMINIDLASSAESQSLGDMLDNLEKIIASSSSDGVVTVKNDFLATGISLVTKANIDLPFLKLKLAPTSDPTVFRGLVYLGLNNFEEDNVSKMDADSERGSDLDYMPGLSDLKDMYEQGANYGANAVSQVGAAANILQKNMRQGKGYSKDGERNLSYALQGYFETEVYYDFNAGEWDMVVVTGGFTAGGGMGYEWTWNAQVGPVPVFLQLGAGAAGAIEFQAAVDRTQNANDYLTELRLYAYLQAFGGLGFDYSIIALKIGLYGRVGLKATLRWLNAIGTDSAQFGAQLNVEGEIGVKLQAELLFISYETIFWSQPIGKYNGTFNDWNEIETYWNKVKDGNSGQGMITPEASSFRALRLASVSGQELYTTEQDAVLVSRDYLDLYERSYNSSGPRLDGGFALFSLFSRSSPVVETLANSYALASPTLSDDGAYLFYLDDGADANDATNVRTAFMERNSSGGYADQGVISVEGYGDSGLRASGTGNGAVAVWSRVTERPAITEPGQTVTPDVQAGMMNSTDIMAAVRSDSGWTVTNLTSGNGVADLSPVVATNGSRILVAWRQVASSGTANLTAFDTRDYIYYTVSENGGSTWTTPQPIYNGTSGSVKGIEAAMLDSGAAAVTFTLQTGEPNTGTGAYYQEVAYAIVDETESGFDVVRYAQMTDDTNLDENPQIAAIQLDSSTEAFVLGWHCLRAEDGTSDIRLTAVDKNGNRITGFVDSLSSLIQNTDVGISANFRFVQNADSLDELSILWSETASEGETSEKPVHDCLNAIRFRTENDQGVTRISMTAAQQIAEMGDYTSIDCFNAYVSDGCLYAAIQGTYYDYENPQSYTVTYGDGSTGTVQVASERTSIYTAVGAYTDTLRVDSVIPDYANIRKGSSLPVQLSITNLGTQSMTKVEVEIGGQDTVFQTGSDSAFVSIAPGETRSLTVFYTVPSEGVIPNPSYTITGTFKDGSFDESEEMTLVLNVPDLGIADSNLLVDAVDGDRILQFNLYNLSDAELADSNRAVCFNLYSDAACTQPIDPQYLTLVQSGLIRSNGALLTVNDDDGLAAIDEGSYTLQYKFDLEGYIHQSGSEFADEDGEVRDGGVTIYAKAWVELLGSGSGDGGEMLEYISSNNMASINLESLLKQANGTPTTVTSVLSNKGEGSSAVVTLQNNSMVTKTTGNLIVTLLDADGKVLASQQSYTGTGSDNGLITLNGEQKLTQTFTFDGKQGASVQVAYSDVILGADNANLTSLTFSNIPGVTLDSFVKGEDGIYRCTVSTDDLTSTAVMAVAESGLAKVRMADTDGGSNTLSQTVTLTPGEVSTISVTVTSNDNTVSKTYILTVQNNGEPVIDEPTGSPDPGETSQYSASTFYAADSAVISLTAAASGSYALSYQWYSCDADGGNAVQLQDETASTLTISNTTDVGVYYYRCKVTRQLLNGGAADYWSSVASVQIRKSSDNSVTLESAVVTFDNAPHGLAGAAAAKEGSTLHYSTDGGQTWSEDSPTFTSVGVHTVWVYASNPNYEDTAVVTADVVIQEKEGTLFKLETSEVSDVYSGYPQAIQDQYSSPEELTDALKAEVTKLGTPENNTAVYEIKMLFSLDDGTTWQYATAENFPAAGVTVKLPYPEGTNRYSYNFILKHLITDPLKTGKTVGEFETLDLTLEEDGIRFTVDCLSPFVLGWSLRPSGNPSYTVAVEKTEHGTVTVKPARASYNSTVTITVKPDDGYKVGAVTVTTQNGRELTVTDKGNNSYTFKMPSGSVSVEVTFIPITCDGGDSCPTHAFTDLSADAWYHEAVDYVLDNGLMGGYGSGRFGPNDTLSRAQLAQILYNREGRPAVSNSGAFNDVPDTMWCYDAVAWANANGIVGGYGNGCFGPNDPITREQLAVMLWRYAGSPATSQSLDRFTDADRIGGYAREAIAWANGNGIVNGYGNGTLNPKGKATRAQVAQMLMNFVKNVKNLNP